MLVNDYQSIFRHLGKTCAKLCQVLRWTNDMNGRIPPSIRYLFTGKNVAIERPCFGSDGDDGFIALLRHFNSRTGTCIAGINKGLSGYRSRYSPGVQHARRGINHGVDILWSEAVCLISGSTIKYMLAQMLPRPTAIATSR